jgi:hypothetical protein
MIRATKRQYSRQMFNLILRLKFCATAAIVLLTLLWVGVLAEDFQLNPVSRELVETRLGKYTGSNKQREATLRQLFVEAGCSEQNISEQQVKGSKLPNVICILPGSSDKVIIVGATSTACPKGTESLTTGAVRLCCRPSTKG